MNYLEKSSWEATQQNEIQYRSGNLANVGKLIKSFQKTFYEGTTIIRSIHNLDKLFFVITTIESDSNYAESQDRCVLSLSDAEDYLIELCEKDDMRYF